MGGSPRLHSRHRARRERELARRRGAPAKRESHGLLGNHFFYSAGNRYGTPNDTATTEIYTLSLHDVPISVVAVSLEITLGRRLAGALGRLFGGAPPPRGE